MLLTMFSCFFLYTGDNTQVVKEHNDSDQDEPVSVINVKCKEEIIAYM